jgi:hypothetical protein
VPGAFLSEVFAWILMPLPLKPFSDHIREVGGGPDLIIGAGNQENRPVDLLDANR